MAEAAIFIFCVALWGVFQFVAIRNFTKGPGGKTMWLSLSPFLGIAAMLAACLLAGQRYEDQYPVAANILTGVIVATILAAFVPVMMAEAGSWVALAFLVVNTPLSLFVGAVGTMDLTNRWL